MSDYNPDRVRDHPDLDTIQSVTVVSEDNDEEFDENAEYDAEIVKKRSTSADKNKNRKQKPVQLSRVLNQNRNVNKPKHSPHMSRHQAYQHKKQVNDEHDANEDEYEEENEEDEDDDENGDDYEENDDGQDENYPLSAPNSHYQNNRSSQFQQQKLVKSSQKSGYQMSRQSINGQPQTQSQSNLRNSNHPSSTSNQAHHYQSSMKHSSPLSVTPKHTNSGLGGHHSGYDMKEMKTEKIDLWGHLLIGISYFFLIFSFPFSLCACVKVAQEYERAVIFRLGRILQGGAKGPGIFFVLPCIDTYTKIDLRTVTFDVPPQEILTKDSVTVSVDAVVYFRIFNAVISVINVEDAAKSTKLLAASTLRNILGTKSLHEILSDRESVAILIQNNLDDATGPWGVKVERVEVKDVRLPVQLQRAMATEAEAAREARAKVIAAEGEQKASKALKEAAEVISESPIAIQLRYLQTLTQIASEKNSTIVFPIPLEMLSFLANKTAGALKTK